MCLLCCFVFVRRGGSFLGVSMVSRCFKFFWSFLGEVSRIFECLKYFGWALRCFVLFAYFLLGFVSWFRSVFVFFVLSFCLVGFCFGGLGVCGFKGSDEA